MKTRVKAVCMLDGKIYTGVLTTEHSASSYGQAVLVLDGIGAVDSYWYELHDMGWKPDRPKITSGM